jgi:hypothetical protein
LVLDFGGSHIKRGLALYEHDMLTALRPLSPLPARWIAPDEHGAYRTHELAEYMAAVIADTWRDERAVYPELAPSIVASIACYIADGQPFDYDRGAYAALRTLSNNLGRWLAQRVSQQVGQPVTVELIQDGTAAARVYAGQPHTAVIMLGTALGIGFAPYTDCFRPLRLW